jgi:hypothetical protein
VIETTSFRVGGQGEPGILGVAQSASWACLVDYFLMYEITAHGGFVGSGLGTSTTVGGIVGLTWLAGTRLRQCGLAPGDARELPRRLS